MSIERFGLILGMLSAVFMAAESIVNRFDRIERRLEEPLTLPSKPKRLLRWALRRWQLILVLFFVAGYFILLSTLNPQDESIQPAIRYAAIGGTLAVFGLSFDEIAPRLRNETTQKRLRFIAFAAKLLAAVLLAPFWITGGLVGVFLFLLVLIAYAAAFPLFFALRGAYWLKRKKFIKGVFSSIGFALLGLSFAIEYATTP